MRSAISNFQKSYLFELMALAVAVCGLYSVIHDDGSVDASEWRRIADQDFLGVYLELDRGFKLDSGEATHDYHKLRPVAVRIENGLELEGTAKYRSTILGMAKGDPKIIILCGLGEHWTVDEGPNQLSESLLCPPSFEVVSFPRSCLLLLKKYQFTKEVSTHLLAEAIQKGKGLAARFKLFW